jgi:pyrroline-5-carboxylate reductase
MPGRRELVAAIDPGLVIDANNTPVAQNAAVLVLAVKPQILPEVALALASQRRPAGQLVMSVAAGVTLRSLAGWLGGTTPLVRVMPNQPATIGAGVSALAASASVDTNGRQLAGYVAGTTGRALWLPDESLMDAVTAVSGSGPGLLLPAHGTHGTCGH